MDDSAANEHPSNKEHACPRSIEGELRSDGATSPCLGLAKRLGFFFVSQGDGMADKITLVVHFHMERTITDAMEVDVNDAGGRTAVAALWREIPN
jgi:hypothetical protein